MTHYDNIKVMMPLMTSSVASGSPSLNISSEFEKPRLRRFSASSHHRSPDLQDESTSTLNSSFDEPMHHSRNGSTVVHIAHDQNQGFSRALFRQTPSARRCSLFRWTIIAAIFISSILALTKRDAAPSLPMDSITKLSVFNRKPAPFCTPYQMLRGHWEPSKTPIQTIDDLKRVRGYRPYQKLGKAEGIEDTERLRDDGLYCWPEKFNKSDPLETYESVRLEEIDRILRVGRQTWISEAAERGDCQIIPWDWMAVVRRLASSQLGIIYLGDSLTSQAFDSLALLLGNKGPITERHFSPGRRLDTDRGLFLDPNHELTPLILKGLDVPLSRLERPLALQHRANNLVTVEDYEEIGLDYPILGTPWENELLWWKSKAVEADGQGKVWANRDIIFTSTGAWYQRWLVKEDTSARLIKLREVAQKSLRRLDKLTRTSHFTVFYRTVNRAHANCHNHKFAVPAGNVSVQAPLDHNGWFITPAINDIFREIVSRYLGDHMQLLDIEEMSAQRPEAHAVPEAGDCLHHCLPSITDEWNWSWWHALIAREKELAAGGKN